MADISDSAGTAWFDLKNRKWSETLLDFGRMRSDQMLELVEGCEKVGELRPDIAREWGLHTLYQSQAALATMRQQPVG